MNRLIFLILFLAIGSQNASACLIPDTSWFYDRLVTVKYDDRFGGYLIQIKKDDDKKKLHSVTLSIDSAFGNDVVFQTEIATEFKKDKFIASVTSLKDSKLQMNITVYWQGDGDICPTISTIELD